MPSAASDGAPPSAPAGAPPPRRADGAACEAAALPWRRRVRAAAMAVAVAVAVAAIAAATGGAVSGAVPKVGQAINCVPFVRTSITAATTRQSVSALAYWLSVTSGMALLSQFMPYWLVVPATTEKSSAAL